MQLNVTTDYAIRMTLFLAILGTPMGSEDISKQMGIPKQMIAQIAKPLRDAGIIATKRGVGGGFSLNRNRKTSVWLIYSMRWKELPGSTVAWKKIATARGMQRRHARSESSIRRCRHLWMKRFPVRQLRL